MAERPLADVVQHVVAARAPLDALLLQVIDLDIHRSPETRPVRSEVDRLLRLALGGGRRRSGALTRPTGVGR